MFTKGGGNPTNTCGLQQRNFQIKIKKTKIETQVRFHFSSALFARLLANSTVGVPLNTFLLPAPPSRGLLCEAATRRGSSPRTPWWRSRRRCGSTARRSTWCRGPAAPPPGRRQGFCWTSWGGSSLRFAMKRGGGGSAPPCPLRPCPLGEQKCPTKQKKQIPNRNVQPNKKSPGRTAGQPAARRTRRSRPTCCTAGSCRSRRGGPRRTGPPASRAFARPLEKLQRGRHKKTDVLWGWGGNYSVLGILKNIKNALKFA